jgi:predicted DCC family thiol-disulfide oxidoreductase YuxK
MSTRFEANASPVGAGKKIEKPIIFFDGVCGMCNAFVDLAMRVDRHEQFFYAPLQGSTAHELLPPLPPDPKNWSMIYLDERGEYDQSDASLEVYRRLGGIWWFLSLGRVVPAFLRDPLYRFVAHNRYKWFGEKDTCRLPTPAERKRFLP